MRIEEAIQGIDGVKRMVSTATEGMGSVTVEIEFGADARRVRDDIKNRVDTIETFPQETERPIIRELVARTRVIDLAVSGQAGEFALRAAADRIRNELSSSPEISLVQVAGARPYEISIEVSESALRRHALSFDELLAPCAARHSTCRAARCAPPAARSCCGRSGRPTAARNTRILSCWRGPMAPASCSGTWRRSSTASRRPTSSRASRRIRAMVVSVFRTGGQSALEIAARVHEYAARTRPTLPEGISLTVWQDDASAIEAQLSTMLRNGLGGFLLVFLVQMELHHRTRVAKTGIYFLRRPLIPTSPNEPDSSTGMCTQPTSTAPVAAGSPRTSSASC